MSFVFPAPAGCEDLLEAELLALGADARQLRRAHGAVSLGLPAPTLAQPAAPSAAELTLALRGMLHSRIASRLLLGLARFACTQPADLYTGVRAMPWDTLIAPGASFAVDVPRGEGALDHTHYAAQLTKDGVVDALRDARGERPNVDRTNPDVRVHVLLRRGEATVSLDLAGEGLHRRGYRRDAGQAPLKENLAAAVLMRCGWPRRAQAGESLADPMCGSGTLLVEAAWMAIDMPPTALRRRYAASHWLGLDVAAWERAQLGAREAAQAAKARLVAGALRGRLTGRDNDPMQVRRATEALENAWLGGVADLGCADVSALKLEPQAGPGSIVCNPPYGERLGGDEAALQLLYDALGAALRRHPGWSGHVLLADLELGHALGLRAARRHALRNGPLACSLLHFLPRSKPVDAATAADAAGDAGAAAGAGHTPAGRAPARPVDRNAPPPRPAEPEGVGMVRNRLVKNLRRLARWRARDKVGAFRVYDADLPEYNAAVDVYDGLDGERRVHVQEYRAPAAVPEAKANARLRTLLLALPEALEVAPARVVLKQRRPTRPGAQYGAGGEVAGGARAAVPRVAPQTGDSSEMQVVVADLNRWVCLDAYLDTGLYLDQRPLRRELRRQAAGKDALNLFCYTGAASVFLAAGEARRTTSVDLSKTYLSWAANNLRANGLQTPAHQLVHADVLAYVAEEGASGPRHDIVFCGPPTFTNSRRAEDDFDVVRDHAELIGAVMKLVRRGGVLYFSSHARRLRLDAALAQRFGVEDISERTRPEDFSRGRPHQTFRIVHRGA